MFEWYFKDYYISNKIVFCSCIILLLIMFALTIAFVTKELKDDKNAYK